MNTKGYRMGDIVISLKTIFSEIGKASTVEGLMEMVVGVNGNKIWFESTGSGNGSFSSKDFRAATPSEIADYSKGIRKINIIKPEITNEYQIY